MYDLFSRGEEVSKKTGGVNKYTPLSYLRQRFLRVEVGVRNIFWSLGKQGAVFKEH